MIWNKKISKKKYLPIKLFYLDRTFFWLTNFEHKNNNKIMHYPPLWRHLYLFLHRKWSSAENLKSITCDTLWDKRKMSVGLIYNPTLGLWSIFKDLFDNTTFMSPSDAEIFIKSRCFFSLGWLVNTKKVSKFCSPKAAKAKIRSDFWTPVMTLQ